jgi:hypothetical protein
MNQVLNKCDNQNRCDGAVVLHLRSGDLPGWEPYGLLDSSGLPKNRLCKVEQHNAGTQIAPCPCAAGKLGCAGVP